MTTMDYFEVTATDDGYSSEKHTESTPCQYHVSGRKASQQDSGNHSNVHLKRALRNTAVDVDVEAPDIRAAIACGRQSILEDVGVLSSTYWAMPITEMGGYVHRRIAR